MKKLLALISARNKEFYRDRTTMIWTLLFPFIVLLGFRYGYSGKQDPILKVAVFVGVATSTNLPSSLSSVSSVMAQLKQVPGLELTEFESEAASLKKLEHYETDLAISLVEGQKEGISYSLNADSDKGKLAEQLLFSAVSKIKTAQLKKREVVGQHIRYSDWLLPGLLAMNIMFGSMFGVGYVIVRYRKNGVLKRLRGTPLSAFQFLCAQVVSRVLLMVVTSYMVLGGAMLLVGFRPQAMQLSLFFDLTVFLCVSAAAMISVGLVVAARISSEEVADGVLNLMTWPMIFLSGIWFSIDGATSWVRFAAQLVPLTHVVDGLRSILIEGAGLSQVLPQVTGLMMMSAVLLILGSAIFKWR